MAFHLLSFKYLKHWPNIQTNITHASLNEMYPFPIRRDTWKENKPPDKDGSNQTIMLLSCASKMSFECQEGHRLSWRLSYFLQSLQPNAGKVHQMSFILNHPVLLQCSRRINKKISQTQHNLINGTLHCYMFRSAGNDHQTFHTKHSKHIRSCVLNVAKYSTIY
jgi:hypothetical protein